MLLKLLGIIDILAIISLLAVNILPQPLVLFMALYLIIKGALFTIIGGQLPSLFDVVSGIYIAAASYGISHWIITVIIMIYIGQKAIISLF